MARTQSVAAGPPGGRTWETFLRLAERITPEVAGLDEEERDAFRRLIEDTLSSRGAGVVRRFRLLLFLLRFGPVLVYGRPLEGLPPLLQDRVLRWFEDAPSAHLRSGFLGLKILVFLGYYGRPACGESVGWRPSFDGNAALARRRER